MTLEAIERYALGRFQRLDIDSSIPDVNRQLHPQAAVEPYPAAAGEDNSRKAEALTAWVTVPSADSFRGLAMKVLSEVLLSNAGSPLRKALIDSGLGSALADGSGLHDDYKESVFGAGLKGIAPEDAEKVQQVVLATLEQVAQDGVDSSMVDAAIHHLEFEKRERSNAGFPYALRLLFAALPSYQYGGDPFSAMNFDTDLERLERARSEGRFFENLIRAELLDNPYRALLTVVPDTEMEERQRRAELDRLAAIESRLTDDERARIVARVTAPQGGPGRQARPCRAAHPRARRHPDEVRGGARPRRDRAPGAAGVLPAADQRHHLPRRPERLLIAVQRAEGHAAALQPGAHPQRCGRPGLRGDRGPHRVGHRRRRGSGPGAIARSAGGLPPVVRHLGLCARPQRQPFIELLTDLVVRLEIEPRRLKEIIAETATRLESSLAGLGFQFALLRAHSKLSSEGAINDRLQGIGMLHTMRRLARLDEKSLGDVIRQLDDIRKILFRAEALRIVVTCEEAMVRPLAELLGGLIGSLQADGASGPPVKPMALERAPEARTAPVPVAFNVRVFQDGLRHMHADSPALLVLANYLRDTFLHRELREKGGEPRRLRPGRRGQRDLLLRFVSRPEHHSHLRRVRPCGAAGHRRRDRAGGPQGSHPRRMR